MQSTTADIGDTVVKHQKRLNTVIIHLYSPYNMVAQANNTGTSKNTTNERNNDSSTLHNAHKLKH